MARTRGGARRHEHGDPAHDELGAAPRVSDEAINKDAPHPAAARLWQEFIFSDTAQNLYLEAGAFPVRLAAMDAAGTVDAKALKAAGGLPEEQATATTEQTDAANTLLAAEWPKVIS